MKGGKNPTTYTSWVLSQSKRREEKRKGEKKALNSCCILVCVTKDALEEGNIL